MSRNVAHKTFRLIICLVVLAGLGACGGSHTHHASKRGPTRYYPPPGSASDPWGPYIREASGRFSVPETWVRRVMRQESGGQEDVISWAGAMGLMQVMPETYDGLRDRYNLGDDPFEPRNNILAGTAYLKEMYDRFGAPGFLAAYNAGPNRLDRYLNHGTPLPAETVNYVASIAPLLGPETPMSGPLAFYGTGRAYASRAAARSGQSGCDPDAAYNPDGPCAPRAASVLQTASLTAVPKIASYCDADAAYDPTRRCLPAPPVVGQAAPESVVAQAPVIAQVIEPSRPSRPAVRYVAEARPLQERMGLPVAFSTGTPPFPPAGPTAFPPAGPPAFPPAGPPAFPSAGSPQGQWMIQVGAYSTLTIAQNAAEKARSVAPDLLRMTKIELPATAPLGTQVAFRARLTGLTAAAAADACARLTNRGVTCMTVPPSRDSF